LIDTEDRKLYTLTDDLQVGCESIAGFYRIYHSSRYVGDQLVIRLNHDLTDAEVKTLNQDFKDILVSGQIQKSKMLPGETEHQQPQPQQVMDRTEQLPRLVFHFNQRDLGRLYQMISVINTMGRIPELEHPERK
jgi:hypothetical protein